MELLRHNGTTLPTAPAGEGHDDPHGLQTADIPDMSGHDNLGDPESNFGKNLHYVALREPRLRILKGAALV